MLESREKHLEIKVGIFVLVGLAVAGGLVVQFGRLGERIVSTYRIDVKFPDASGLYKGAEVLMSGARVGRVAGSPELLEEQSGVLVRLSVYEDTKIPKDSVFRVGSSGLLGDRFVQIRPGERKEGEENFIQPGGMVEGKREAGLDDLTRDGQDVMAELKNAVGKIGETLDRIDSQVLTEENLASVSATLKSIEVASEDVAGFTGSFKEWDGKARQALDDVASAAANVDNILARARGGSGLLGAIVNDRQLAEDLKGLISNLRQRGILFYRDVTGSDSNDPEDTDRTPTRGFFGRPARSHR